MMRVRGCAPQQALGQPETQMLSLCSIVSPVTSVPGVRETVQKIGCNPATRAALAAALIENYAERSGVKVKDTPWYAQMLAIAGPDIVADCVCKGRTFEPAPERAAPGLSLGDPLVLGGIAAAIIGAAILIARARASATPAPAPAAPAPAKLTSRPPTP